MHHQGMSKCWFVIEKPIENHVYPWIYRSFFDYCRSVRIHILFEHLDFFWSYFGQSFIIAWVYWLLKWLSNSWIVWLEHSPNSWRCMIYTEKILNRKKTRRKSEKPYAIIISAHIHYGRHISTWPVLVDIQFQYFINILQVRALYKLRQIPNKTNAKMKRHEWMTTKTKSSDREWKIDGGTNEIDMFRML